MICRIDGPAGAADVAADTGRCLIMADQHGADTMHLVGRQHALEFLYGRAFAPRGFDHFNVDAVAAALEESLDEGRRAVARIVGRDPASLDEAGVARAAIESAAENFADGVVAPAVWLAVAGLPGILVCKAINTADSMIGHRNERYAAFGWAAARLDDLLNLVPARLAGLLLAGGTGAMRIMWRDAARHRSPNAGWPEAAMAARLDLALAGPRRYGGVMVEDAWLNPEGRRAPRAKDARAACRVVRQGWWLLLAISLVLWIARW